MGTALLVQFYDDLPAPKGDENAVWESRLRTALERFRKKVAARYTEGTLQRLLESTDTRNRRAAVLALGLMGSMKSNIQIAAALHDEDANVRQLAIDALWTLWFRADSPENNEELRRIMQMRDSRKKLSRLSALIEKAPRFAEAWNQRAILLFRLHEYQKSISDCEKTLKLNPAHFGAQAGMAQCLMQLGKHRAALRSFRNALRVNPGMDGVEETIRALENTLGEEGKK